MRCLVLIGALLGISMLSATAQDFKEYVPHNATVVGSINGNNVLESVTISELDNSRIGKGILSRISSKLNFPVTSFDELGINAKATSYFYYQTTDSLSYATLLLPLKDANFFDVLLKSDSIKVTDKGNYKLMNMGNSNFVAWDQHKVAFISGSYINSYFTADYDFSEIQAEIAANKPEMYEIEIEVPEDGTVAVEDEEVYADLVEVAPVEYYEYEEAPYLSNSYLQQYVDAYFKFSTQFKAAAESNNVAALDALQEDLEYLTSLATEVDTISAYDSEDLTYFMENMVHFLNEAALKFKNAEVQVRALQLIADATYYGSDFVVEENKYAYNYDTYLYDYYEEKKALEARWTEEMVGYVMLPAPKSIISNKDYMKQLDSKAVANIWNSNFSQIIGGMNNGVLPGYNVNPYHLTDEILGYGELSSNLYFENKQARISLDMSVDGDLAKSYERIADQKINRKFFKYLNEDKFLGYLSYNINTKNTLEEYPKILTKTYSAILGNSMKDEIELGAELFSLILDEEAVSDLIKGDAIFVLTDLREREVTYTDYVYDDEDSYEYTEVEKTKTESVPDFLLMASTNETSLTNKTIAYLVKKQLVVQENGYYRITNVPGDFPLEFYFTIKNGIFFLSTSAEEMSSIANNTFKTKLAGKHKKMIKKGTCTAYFNGVKFGKNFPVNANWTTNQLTKANYLIENASNLYMSSNKMKNGKMHSEFVIEIPEGHKNGLIYLMDVFDHLAN